MHTRTRQWRAIRRMSTHTPTSGVTVGIRQEDPNRIWERRAPLTPDAVNYLVTEKNVAVQIQPCDKRVFPLQEYIKAGATVSDTLSKSHIILGIKETPLKQLSGLKLPLRLPTDQNGTEFAHPRTHLMFSHTTKGQQYNMPLLGHFVNPDRKGAPSPNFPTLIDYEHLTTGDGTRTVGFGWYAGVAGVLESLSSMAHAHLEMGIASPFLYTPRPHTLPSLDQLRASLREIGTWIANEGSPAKLGPFVIGVTGTGQVAQGCLSMLLELPIEHVKVSELDALVRNPETNLRKIYLVHAKPQDYLVRNDKRVYDRKHYYKAPQLYNSVFHERVAPYLTLFLNGVGWSPGFPRLMTTEQLALALQKAQTLGGARFTNIGDISCDPAGGLEFMSEVATLSKPFYKYRPKGPDSYLPSVQMMTVDILPSAIPLDASKHFSKSVLPYLENIISTYRNEAPPYGHARALARATIASYGKLAKEHEWLWKGAREGLKTFNQKENEKGSPAARAATTTTATSVPLKSKEAKQTESPDTKEELHRKKKRVLLLGSGMVAGPAVDIIASRTYVDLVVASNDLGELRKVAGSYSNVKYHILDITNMEECERLIREVDVVISLLPTNYHVPVAKECIKLRKHLVTASYISNEMRELDKSAKNVGVLLLNEIGLDPGIDHCSAVDILKRIEQENKTVKSFISFCGGLPAPEVEEVPLRYKFSWRPAGVLMAALNGALYRLNYEDRTIAPANLLKSQFKSVHGITHFPLEGIPNRDSLVYRHAYGLPDDTRTLLRGTLRYPGYSETLQGFKDLGLLDVKSKFVLNNWSSLVSQAIFASSEGRLHEASKVDIPQCTIDALEWLGLRSMPNYPSDVIAMPPLPKDPLTALEHFAYLLASKLRYQPGERDMVVLHHEIVAQGKAPGASEEVYKSSLVTYGTPYASAMARTVGIPVGLAALAVLDGKVLERGVLGPTHSSIIKPVLNGLAKAGLGMKETHSIVGHTASTIEKALSKSMKAQ